MSSKKRAWGHMAPVCWFWAGVLTWSGCASSDNTPDTDQCRGNFLAGDLVISEIMANLSGADEGKEWIEIYNASDKPVDLAGLSVQASQADGSSEKEHVMLPTQIDPGQYLVLGGALPATKPDYVDYVYGADLGALRNTSGRLALLCNGELIDQVIYGEMKEDIAQGFDGAQVPDAVANDKLESWCDAQSEFAAPAKGTPGKVNDPCQGTLPPSTCLENGTPRAIVAPQVGTVIVSELMADPAATSDELGEWLELYLTQDMDVNGLQLGKAADKLTTEVADEECLSHQAGSYLVLALKSESSLNGGLPRVDYPMRLRLSNSGGSIFVGYGGQVLDSMSYGKVGAGVSTSLDPTYLDADDNDQLEHWCKGKEAYGAGDKGTPGAANPSCGFVEEGKCLNQGQARDKVAPVVGDLVISEFMADPKEVSNDAGEWFEVYVARDVDLNGLQLGRTPGTVDLELPEGDCLPAKKGSYLLFARKIDAGENGGLPPVDFSFSFNLNNSPSGIFVGLKGDVLDAIQYTSVTDGVATSLSKSYLDPSANDDPGKWCPAVTTYGPGADRGTPKAENPDCP